MNPNQLAAFKNLEQAQQALKAGDKITARQLVAQAAQLAPELEEVWLLMAALASPRGSVAYLERALQINPNSERAQKGMLWAQGRLKQEQDNRSSVVAQPSSEQPTDKPVRVEHPVSVVPIVAAPAAPDVADTQPTSVSYLEEPTPEPISTPDVVLAVDGKEAVARPRYLSLALLVILVCIVIGWVSSVTPVKAFFSKSFAGQEHGPAWAQADIAKSDATQSAAAPTVLPAAITSEPTDALAQVTPTPTLDILASETPLPTDVAVPTDLSAAPTESFSPTETSPAPTWTPMPTDVVPATTVPGSGSADQPSPTPLPTDTAAPGPTQFVPATPNPNAGSASQGTGHWIDVDLTHQMVYAYDGNAVVNSFLVSTGTWQYPTVTGQYHIYIKLRYKDMSGPGYYLPNVPYTMFFYQGYALHGTYWHSNFGTPMSHGCVNLSIPDSEWVYNFSSVGTLVNVHY
jgi:lipoprotein-anchoring transpeptidase ErfK/SrfK